MLMMTVEDDKYTLCWILVVLSNDCVLALDLSVVD